MLILPKSRLRKFVQEMGQRNPHTPDIAKLEESQYSLLFVCDELMRSQESYKQTLQYISAQATRGFTRHSFDYRIERETNRGLPLIGRKVHIFAPLKIKGEVHAVESCNIPILDNYYRNGVQFHRIRVPILVPWRDHERFYNVENAGRPLPHALRGPKDYHGPDSVSILETYMYVASAKYWNKELDAGYKFPTANIVYPDKPRPWLPKYYRYRIVKNS